MKNTLYAIISSLLVMTILFMLFTNLDLFNQSVVEGNKSIRKQQKKAIKTPIRQNVKKTAKKVCVGKGCNQIQNSDIVSDAPTTRMDDMKAAMNYNNDDSVKDLTQ